MSAFQAELPVPLPHQVFKLRAWPVNHRLGPESSSEALQEFGQHNAGGFAEHEISLAGEGRRLRINLHDDRPGV